MFSVDFYRDASTGFASACAYECVSVFVLDVVHFHIIIIIFSQKSTHFILSYAWIHNNFTDLECVHFEVIVRGETCFIAFASSTKKSGCNVLKLLCLPVKSVGGEILHKLPNLFTLSLFPHQFLASFSERKTKTKLPTQQCHGIQFYWIRVESIQIGKK